MASASDLRVYFAAERTLLAWVRTGVTIIGLGFVVARFGLFLHMLRPADETAAALRGSTVIGVSLELFGALGVTMAAWSHIRFCKQLRVADRPAGLWALWPVVFSLTLAAVGVVLAVYLLLRAEG